MKPHKYITNTFCSQFLLKKHKTDGSNGHASCLPIGQNIKKEFFFLKMTILKVSISKTTNDC